ncbi:MAG: DUF4337 domain-containing protein [Proteobacteria bacterium]|uniref:DUF4337 domain-containing protein n=1 Tax=Rudaea sp. TaxID=2136325 RepID=UPI001D61F161|nr:DUF4337 domain-containing protein [Pseudomonadota bacterium]MBS0566474.1 DUF4337 domain-containing protein [Pseudomonadota bacterium]
MPEEIEIDTDKLHEAIHEEVEKEGGALLRTIALTTALFAAFAAVASLLAGGTVNEALALKAEATQLQAQASDQWAYYQAKGIKAVVLEAQKGVLAGADKPLPADLDRNIGRYKDEQQEAKKKAEEFEHERDEKGKEADHLIHQHHYFAYAVAMLQVAIALGAVAALTRKRAAWLGSTALGLVGALIFLWALFAH